MNTMAMAHPIAPTTAQGVLNFILDGIKEDEKAAEMTVKKTVGQFRAVVQGLLNMDADKAFAVLSEAVAKSKPHENGVPVPKSKPNATVAVRCSELRQIVGAIRLGLDGEIVLSGLHNAAREARLYLDGYRKEEGEYITDEKGRMKRIASKMDAKGKTSEEKEKARTSSSIMKHAELVADATILSEEQRKEVEKGVPLALVITDAQRRELIIKASASKEADDVKRALDWFEKSARKMTTEMVKAGVPKAGIKDMLVSLANSL